MSAYSGLTAAIERAWQDYRHELSALGYHRRRCSWCADGLCRMGRATAQNAAAYGSHLAELEAQSAREAGRGQGS